MKGCGPFIKQLTLLYVIIIPTLNKTRRNVLLVWELIGKSSLLDVCIICIMAKVFNSTTVFKDKRTGDEYSFSMDLKLDQAMVIFPCAVVLSIIYSSYILHIDMVTINNMQKEGAIVVQPYKLFAHNDNKNDQSDETDEQHLNPLTSYVFILFFCSSIFLIKFQVFF